MQVVIENGEIMIFFNLLNQARSKCKGRVLSESYSSAIYFFTYPFSNHLISNISEILKFLSLVLQKQKTFSQATHSLFETDRKEALKKIIITVFSQILYPNRIKSNPLTHFQSFLYERPIIFLADHRKVAKLQLKCFYWNFSRADNRNKNKNLQEQISKLSQLKPFLLPNRHLEYWLAVNSRIKA